MKQAENKHKGFTRSFLPAMGLLLLLIMVTMATVYAGAVLDYGQLSGNPQQANFLAWVGNDVPPLQVLTEDNHNTQDGTDQGYVESSTQAGQNFFLLNSGNFDNPAAVDGAPLHMRFGGEGADSGTIWQLDATYGGSSAFTNHGTVSNTAVGSCPTMLPSSQSAGGTQLSWTGNGANQYHIYRSMNGSGADNGVSNGRYDYLATVAGATESYLDTECVVDTACWHIIVPADAGGNIDGCHSAESPLAEATVQEMLLGAGWNMISSYVHPANADLWVMFAPIQDQMVLLKNGNGEVFWPALGINQIGSWDIVEGYQLYMLSEQTLAVGGGRADLAVLSADLVSGWNMVGYWRETPLATSTAWASLGGDLFLAKDGAGLVYWPSLGIDQIGSLQPGQGYQIYMDAAGTLSYPVSGP